MLLVRAALSIAIAVCGAVIVARMLQSREAGVAIVPGLVLGAAMIALGIYRISLILRVRGTM